MRKTMIVLLSVLLLTVVVIVLLLSYPSLKAIEKGTSTNLSSVSTTVAVTERKVAEMIARLFSGNRPSDKFGRFSLATASDQIFPEESQLRAHSTNDPSLERYLAIDPGLRKNDFYLYEPTGDYYWHSEYYYNGAPAKFRCSFIIHLEPEADKSTKIEIFEYLPQVWAGKRFDLRGHSGPGFYNDIREVNPTTTDRVELLNRITDELNKGQGTI